MLANAYNETRLAEVALGMSATTLIGSTSVLHTVLLKRALQFPVAVANDLAARIISITVSIVLGLSVAGYWALVAGAIAQSLATGVGVWWKCRWTPALPRRVEGAASMVRYAMHIYGRFSINYVARNLDNVLVGAYFGAHALGLYKKAYDLFALTTNQLEAPVTSVAMATLSRMNRSTGEYRAYLVKGLTVMAFVGMGVGTILTLVGADLIRLLLGPDGKRPAASSRSLDQGSG